MLQSAEKSRDGTILDEKSPRWFSGRVLCGALSCVSRDLYLSHVNLYRTFQCLLTIFFKKGRPGKGIKFQLCCNALLEKFVFEKNEMVSLDVWFPADTKAILNLGMLKRQLNAAYREVEKCIDAFVEGG